MNVTILIGRLTKEPELRHTPQGSTTTTFTMAVDRERKDGGADFPTVVAWGKTAEFVCNYMRKGSKLAVRGRIQTRDYDGKDGQKHYVTEVVADRAEFADGKPQGQQAGPDDGFYPADDYQEPPFG